MYGQACGDDSDNGSPKENLGSVESSNLHLYSQQVRDSNVKIMEEDGNTKKFDENSLSELDQSCVSPAVESYHSTGEMLSSMDPRNPSSVSVNESGNGNGMTPVISSSYNTKRSTFWARSNVS